MKGSLGIEQETATVEKVPLLKNKLFQAWENELLCWRPRSFSKKHGHFSVVRDNYIMLGR